MLVLCLCPRELQAPLHEMLSNKAKTDVLLDFLSILQGLRGSCMCLKTQRHTKVI